MEKKSPEEVKHAVIADLKAKSLSRTEVASLLGIKKQSLANILCEKDYFRLKAGLRFSQSFNYNIDFLLKGEGNLLPEDPDLWIARPSNDVAEKDRAKVKKLKNDCFEFMLRAAELTCRQNVPENVKTLWKNIMPLAYAVKSTDLLLERDPVFSMNGDLLLGWGKALEKRSQYIVNEIEKAFSALQNS